MKKIAYGLLAFSPAFAFAVLENVNALVVQIAAIVKLIVPIIFGLAIIYFFWGLVKFIRAAGDPKAASEGKSIMIYGVIAIAVMISIYGLVGWLQTTLGITNNPTTITVPSY